MYLYYTIRAVVCQEKKIKKHREFYPSMFFGVYLWKNNKNANVLFR